MLLTRLLSFKNLSQHRFIDHTMSIQNKKNLLTVICKPSKPNDYNWKTFVTWDKTKTEYTFPTSTYIHYTIQL